MKTCQVYLATMEHIGAQRTRPINRGLVTMRDDYTVIDGEDETPVEDFGCYITQATPFPPTDSPELFEMFLALMNDDV